MRTSEFQPGDLLIVDDLEDVSDQWKDLLLRDSTLIDSFRQDKQRVIVFFLKSTGKTAYVANITKDERTISAVEISFRAEKELALTSLRIDSMSIFDQSSCETIDMIVRWGIPCLVRVFRDGKEFHRCLTSG